MSTTTVDAGTSTVPSPKETCRRGPIVSRTLPVESSRLANAKCVGDLVHGRALVHVRPVGPETKTAVEVRVRGWDAGDVGDSDVLASTCEAAVACHGQTHGLFDSAVGVGLVCGWVGGFF
ncbi:hypothetical protein HG530_015033 [Fusarium avenaceum]|nr:hypothetical protein HG530_015033 [Fusarium avenaceum]